MNQNEPVARLFLIDSADLLQQSMVKLKNCLVQLSPSQIGWLPHPAGNSIGNLVLHMCGNLKQWTAAGILGQVDARDRDREFASRSDWSSPDLLRHLGEHVEQARQFLESSNAETLRADYVIQGFKVNGLQAINHTTTHFVGHTHQIILLTRIQLGDRYRFAWSPEDGTDQLPI